MGGFVLRGFRPETKWWERLEATALYISSAFLSLSLSLSRLSRGGDEGRSGMERGSIKDTGVIFSIHAHKTS